MPTYSYPRPGYTADVLIVKRGSWKILLIQRKDGPDEPFPLFWALPGGYVNEGETAEEAAGRELEEEAGVVGIVLRQLKTYDKPGRDPRGWVVSVAHVAFVPEETQASTSSEEVNDTVAHHWFSLRDLLDSNFPTLAFDHSQIIREMCDSLNLTQEILNEYRTTAD